MPDQLRDTGNLLQSGRTTFGYKKQQSIKRGKICVTLHGKDHNCYKYSEKGQITRGGSESSFIWHMKDIEDLDKQTEDSIIAQCPFLWSIFPVGLQGRRQGSI